jgi:hypothetical protein
MRLTAARIVLVGAVLLVALGGVYVADRNRAHSHISTLVDALGKCYDDFACNERVVARLQSTKDDWRERKGWYEYAGAALVVLTLAGAFAVSRRPGAGA